MLEPIQKSACVAGVPSVSSPGVIPAEGAGGSEAVVGPTASSRRSLAQDFQAARVPTHLAPRRL